MYCNCNIIDIGVYYALLHFLNLSIFQIFLWERSENNRKDKNIVYYVFYLCG